MAGARGKPAARAGPRIIAVVRNARRSRARRRSAFGGGRAMPERTRRGGNALALTRVSLSRRRAFRWLMLPAAQWALPCAWAEAARIASARVWPAQEYTRVIFESPAPIEHQLVVLRDPNRVVLDLARVVPSPDLERLPAHVQANDPYIAAIRIGRPSEGFLRVVLDLKTDVRTQVFALPPVSEFGHRLVVDLYPQTPIDPLMALLQSEGIDARAPAPATAARDGAPRRAHQAPARRITVAVDPGHGGEDPGAVGHRGTYEKNVVLAIGRRLSRVLASDRNMRVMLTRNDDFFVPLAERVS